MAHPLDIGTKKGGACPPPPPKRAPVARPAPERPFTPPPPPPPAMPGPCCPSTNTVVMHDTVIKSDDGTIEVHPGYDHGKPAYFLKVNAELVRPNIYGEYPIEVHEGTVAGEPADLIVIREMAGATADADGNYGIPPKPVAGDQDKFLRGDGTWSEPSMEDLPVFTGATAERAGAKGLVPAPATGDRGKFLKGDGTWAAVPESYTPIACSAQLMDTWLDAVDAEDNTPEVNGNG